MSKEPFLILFHTQNIPTNVCNSSIRVSFGKGYGPSVVPICRPQNISRGSPSGKSPDNQSTHIGRPKQERYDGGCKLQCTGAPTKSCSLCVRPIGLKCKI